MISTIIFNSELLNTWFGSLYKIQYLKSLHYDKNHNFLDLKSDPNIVNLLFNLN